MAGEKERIHGAEKEEYQIGREGQDRPQGGPSAYFSKLDLVPALERKKNAYPSLLYHVVLNSQDP